MKYLVVFLKKLFYKKSVQMRKKTKSQYIWDFICMYRYACKIVINNNL